MVARKRDDNKIVLFVRKRENRGLETTGTELTNYIMKTFGITYETSACAIKRALIARKRLIKNKQFIYTLSYVQEQEKKS